MVDHIPLRFELPIVPLLPFIRESLTVVFAQGGTTPVKSTAGPPIGNAAAGHIRIIAWCKACRHQVEPDLAEMAARQRLRARLERATSCGSRDVDMVVTERRQPVDATR
jgi:hypothetical protein